MLYKLILVIIGSYHGTYACEACQGLISNRTLEFPLEPWKRTRPEYTDNQKIIKGSGQGCVEANLEEIIPEDVIDSQQIDSNIEYRIEYEDHTNAFFSKNWIDCQEIMEENEKQADILLIDQGKFDLLCENLTAKVLVNDFNQLLGTSLKYFSDKILKYIYAFDSRNPNITTLTKRTDSIRLINSEF